MLSPGNLGGIHTEKGVGFLSSDLQIRDKQNQKVDSSEQYAINVMGERALQSADYVMKKSKEAVKRAFIEKSTARRFKRGRQGAFSSVPQEAEQRSGPETPPPLPTPEHGDNPPKSADAQIPVEPPCQPAAENRGEKTSEPCGDYTKPAPAISGPETSEESPLPLHKRATNPSPTAAPASAQIQGRNPQPKHTSHQNAPKNVPPAKAATHPVSEEPPHMRATDSSLRLSEEHSLNTWQKNSVTNGLQNQGAAIHTAETSSAAVQTFQAAGQSAGSAGANAAAPGVGAALQATEKAVEKIKDTIENIAASVPRSSSPWGALAALFLMPLLVIAAIAGAFRGGGSAKNVNLSADVIALMPQISAACQTHGIPEYAPLVAAVIMQESGGRVDDAGGDVMQCAEGMGLPVGTPVSVEESINFGTGIIARNLREAGATGPTDIPAISLALQGYNFGNGYISWALARGGYSKDNAREFSEMQAAAHGWGGYGDIDYVDHVLRYYQVSVGSMGDASAIAGGRFAYPLPGHPWDTYPGHNGIDISFANCYGEPVYAVAAGSVRYTQDGWTPAHGVGGMWSFGNSVFIEHGDGWISAYGHFSALAVASGETVTQGQLIGYIGSTGNSTGPHLHLALYHNGDAGIGGQNFAELAWPQ